jgi:hypothetical protein
VIVLLDKGNGLDVAEKELGCEVEQLLTPLTRFNRQRPEQHFAIDNGAYAGLNVTGFLSLLEREKSGRHLCRFVAVPDVVGSARRTLEVFDGWKYRPELSGWPLALVAQDGLEDLTIPWKQIAAIFIGGTTGWKLGNHAANVIRAAKALGKWVHAGRVNTPARFEYFEKLGADSMDGTGLSRYTHMRQNIYDAIHSPKLFTDGADRSLVSLPEIGLVGTETVLDSVRSDTEGQRG